MSYDRLAEFEPIFYPKSVAVIGASAKEYKFSGRYLRTLLDFGFEGRVYPINPRETEIAGLKAYPAIRDVPEPIDFAIISVPAKLVPGVLEDCLAKGVKAAEIFTAGFSEVGDEGRILEAELAKIAKRGIRTVGPNCFGVYCPASRLTLLPGADFSTESGPVALISQSGGHAQEIAREAKAWGIRFSKVISYGNACDLNEADFLEYLAQDPKTGIIAAYIEGPKDGPRFMKIVQEASKTKPVIIWKAGLTKAGARAVNSHTASLGGEVATWGAFFKQTGAVRVEGKEELIDTMMAFLYLPRSTGRRVAVIGGGGGMGVTAADACSHVDLSVPAFAPHISEHLGQVLPPVGTSAANPVDVGAPVVSPQVFQRVLEITASAENIDTIIATQTIHLFMSAKMKGQANLVSMMVEDSLQIPAAVSNRFKKPVVMVLPIGSTEVDSLDIERARREFRDFHISHGIPVYPSLQRAARAVAHVVRYYEKGS
jgi:acyl-CoA synthetase (NDP forming)